MENWEKEAQEIRDRAGELSAKALMQEYRTDCGSDPWGHTMAWWFAVAGEMWERGISVPYEWQYRASPFGGRDPDAYETPLCAAASDQALILFGRAMNRYATNLKTNGKDY